MIHYVRIAGEALVIALSTLPPAAQAAQTYLGTYVYETATTSTRVSETLTLRHENAAAYLGLSDASGASLSLPTNFAQDGEITADSTDPSVICYNMAAAALFANREAPQQPGSIFIRFGAGAVAIPLALKSTQASKTTTVYSGSGHRTVVIGDDASAVPADLGVSTQLTVTRGVLSDVEFNETTAIGVPGKVVSRMACTLAHPGSHGPFRPSTATTSV